MQLGVMIIQIAYNGRGQGQASHVGASETKQVTFLHAFSLAGLEEELGPGTYTVETIEEPIDGLSFVAYRRVSTTIVLPSRQLRRRLQASGDHRPARSRSRTKNGCRLCQATPMTEILLRWIAQAHAERLVVGSYAAITAVVFLVLGMQLAVP